MMKRYLLCFFVACCAWCANGQTVSNPGKGDSLYPVNNFFYPGILANLQPYRLATSVFNIAKSNGKYYLLGNFTHMTENSGSALVVDTSTNTILNNRKWRINGVVKAVIPDGQGGFYIGGTFTKIGDSSRKYIARINSNGSPTSWKPACDNIVNALYKRNDTLFIGGAFKNFSGKSRSCFAMYSTTGDSLCTNGGIQAFTFMQTINCFLVVNDTLIYGGLPTNTDDKNIRKYNFKNHVNMGWGLTYTDYGDVKFIQLSPDRKVLLYGAYYNGEYIKGASNGTGAQQYFINLSMNWIYGSNTGSVWGMQVSGSKAYAVGNFEFLLNNSGTFARKGFFAFDPSTGDIKPENLNLNGYASFLEARDGKLLIGGKFSVVNGVSRDQFAVVDTGTLAVGNWQPQPSDNLTAIAFTGNTVFMGGLFRGINAAARNGFAAIDSSTHALEAWNPINMNIMEGKRMMIRGDSLFVLGYTANSGCYPNANTRFRVYSLSTGAEYSINEAPGQQMNDFIIDGDYMYVAYDRKLRRYSLPSLVWDMSWGHNWAGGIYEHSLIHLVADASKIYAVGDTRYTSCASQSFAYRGYLDVYSKATGAMLNFYYYEGAQNQYDRIEFTHAMLTGERLYVQGYFNQLSGNPRKNFVCLNVNTGAITPWQVSFPNNTFSQSYFNSTSDLKLYNGKLWFGSGTQTLSDGSQFKGFGAIDTATGALSLQPLDLKVYLGADDIYQGTRVNDFIISSRELTIGGNFDTVNTRNFRNFAVFPLDGTSLTPLCAGTNTTINAGITGNVYQWQMDSGGGFTNISDNSNFSGSATASLQLINAPSAWNGYQLRCVTDGGIGDIFKLEFTNTWTGAVSTAWENPANWSCNTIPDATTNVVINSGTVVVNASTTIRTLLLSPGVNFTVNPGVNLVILH